MPIRQLPPTAAHTDASSVTVAATAASVALPAAGASGVGAGGDPTTLVCDESAGDDAASVTRADGTITASVMHSSSASATSDVHQHLSGS